MIALKGGRKMLTVSSLPFLFGVLCIHPERDEAHTIDLMKYIIGKFRLSLRLFTTIPTKRSHALAPIYANARIFRPHGDNEQHISDIIFRILSLCEAISPASLLSYIGSRCHQFMSLIFD